MVGLLNALRRVVLDETRETAIAALDWALHAGRVDEMDVASIMLAVPMRRRIPWAALDPLCESLPESLVRTRLRDAGFVVRSQVVLPNGQRIDLVVDEIVGLETDGEAFHADRFAEDRAKDGLIIRQGYVPYRVPAATVFRDWDEVVATVESAIVARRFGNSGVEEPQRLRKRLRRTIRAATPEFPKHAGMRAGDTGLA